MSIVEIGALAIIDLYIFDDETNGDAERLLSVSRLETHINSITVSLNGDNRSAFWY